MIELIEITDKEFKQISEYVYKHFGINLTEAKKGLVQTRLQSVLRKLKFNSFSEYFNYVLNDSTGYAISELVNRISTNHTFFYRENEHFEYFYSVAFPELCKRLEAAKNYDIRIWSAGCSSGEEPYMLVILMMEYLGNNYKKWSAGILATDISEHVLNIARDGIYSKENLAALPKTILSKYFNVYDDNNWVIKDFVKKEVTFRRFNLMNEVFPFKKKFHIIFCRNVMIYFDIQTKIKLVERFYNSLEENGLLFLGHSESLHNVSNKFKYVIPAVYKKLSNNFGREN